MLAKYGDTQRKLWGGMPSWCAGWQPAPQACGLCHCILRASIAGALAPFFWLVTDHIARNHITSGFLENGKQNQTLQHGIAVPLLLQQSCNGST
jgi:hypothetical protein